MRQPTQRELDFMEAERIRARRASADAREEALDALLAGPLAHYGHKHFAELLGLGIEQVARVYHWQERRNHQRPPAELLLAVVAADEGAWAALCDLAGYERSARKATLPFEEQVKRYRQALLEFGAAGEEKDRRIRAARTDEVLR